MKTNHRRFPDANHQPCHLASIRRQAAQERQAAYDLLSIEEKLSRLPPEPACQKQRARLQPQLSSNQKTK
jgi:hypothetical protein